MVRRPFAAAAATAIAIAPLAVVEVQSPAAGRPAQRVAAVAADGAAGGELASELPPGGGRGGVRRASGAMEEAEGEVAERRLEAAQAGEVAGGAGEIDLTGEPRRPRRAPAAGARRQRGEPRHDVGRRGLEPGQQAMAHPIAWRRQDPIGGVVDGREAARGQGRGELAPAQSEERAEDAAVPRQDAGEAVEPAAEEQPQEDGLGLVVGVVRGEDEARAVAIGVLREEGVAAPAGGILDAAAARVELRRVEAGDRRLDAEAGREPTGGVGAAGRSRVEAVVDVEGQGPHSEPWRDGCEPLEERRRVGSAGVGDDDGLVTGGAVREACRDGRRDHRRDVMAGGLAVVARCRWWR